MDKPLVLLVDDEKLILKALLRTLHTLPIEIETFDEPLLALEFCKNQQVDLVISDHRMPRLTGTALLSEIRQLHSHTQCILLSAYNDFSEVADAFNRQIIERYICKPWDNDELCFVVKKILGLESVKKPEPAAQQNPADSKVSTFHGIYSQAPSMIGVFDKIRKASTSNVPIFICGETGTGKEMVARACHSEGYRRKEDFVAVNCANFTESLMESQLYGHKKGVFTGAVNDQMGLLSQAGKGTLFLDEVTTLPLHLQAKLLRVIQERSFSPLGSQEVISYDAQLITASSTTLADAVLQGEFREDLYYRLNVIEIELPTLRDRHGDVRALAEIFLMRFCQAQSKNFTGFDSDAQQLLQHYPWPGNIRQLENIIHNIVILNDANLVSLDMLEQPLKCRWKDLKEIGQAEQPQIAVVHSAQTDSDIIKPLWQEEKDVIERAIRICDGNVPKAAALLEVSASTLYRKRQTWGLA